MARAADDVRQLNPMINPGVGLITESLLGIVVPLLFIAFLRLELLLAPGLFVVAFGFALRRYMRQLNPVSGAMHYQFGVMNAGLNESIVGIEVVKATAQEAQEKRKFFRNASRYRDHFVEQRQVQARYLPLLLIGFALTGAFAHGLLLVSRDALSVGELVAYMGLVGVLRFPTFISIFTFSPVQLGAGRGGAHPGAHRAGERTRREPRRAFRTHRRRGGVRRCRLRLRRGQRMGGAAQPQLPGRAR